MVSTRKRFLLLILLLLGGVVPGGFAFAGVDDNTFGFAWTETVGWIIFNSDAREWTGPNDDPDRMLLDFGIPVGASSDDAHRLCSTFSSSCTKLDYSDSADSIWAIRPFDRNAWGGWRWTDLEFSDGTTIDETYVKLKHFGTGNFSETTQLAFELQKDPPTFSSGNDPYDRWNNNPGTSVSWNWSGGLDGFQFIGDWRQTPSLRQGLQDVVDLLSLGETLSDTVLYEFYTGTTSNPHHDWFSFDEGYSAARLYVEYTSGGTSYDFTFDAGAGEDFGVHVNPLTGDFESTNPNGTGAYAWSSNLGWIKFDPTTTPPAFGEQHAARINLDGGSSCGGVLNAVCGWARACSTVDADGDGSENCEGPAHSNTGGWDGWMYLGEIGSSEGLTYNDDTKTINGWAWSGNEADGEGIGWISFNRYDSTATYPDNTDTSEIQSGGITFATSFLDPEVPPVAVNLRETYNSYCTAPIHHAPVVVTWDFFDANSGDEQTAFQVLMRDNASPSTSSCHYNSCITGGSSCTDSSAGTCTAGGNTCVANPRPVFTAAGTVSTNAGSALVSGAGTDFTASGDNIQPDDRILIGGEHRIVKSVNSATELEVWVAFEDAHTNLSMRVNAPRWIDCTQAIPYDPAQSTGGNPPTNDNSDRSKYTVWFNLSTHHWTVNIKDTADLWSSGSEAFGSEAWTNFSPVNTFETINHQYPKPFFSTVSLEPEVGEIVEFTDASDCYWSGGTSRNVRYDCSAEYPPTSLTAYNRYEWDFDGDGFADNECDSNPSEDGTIENADCFPVPNPLEHVYNIVTLDIQAQLRVTDYEIASKGVSGGAYERKLNPANGACIFTIADPFDVFPRTIQWREISPF